MSTTNINNKIRMFFTHNCIAYALTLPTIGLNQAAGKITFRITED